jgi:hypothetical protein
MKFYELPSHIQMTLLNEAMAFKRNYFGEGKGWIQQMRDVEARVKEHLPDITDEQMQGLLFNAESIYCQITHVPRQLFDIIHIRAEG